MRKIKIFKKYGEEWNQSWALKVFDCSARKDTKAAITKAPTTTGLKLNVYRKNISSKQVSRLAIDLFGLAWLLLHAWHVCQAEMEISRQSPCQVLAGFWHSDLPVHLVLCLKYLSLNDRSLRVPFALWMSAIHATMRLEAPKTSSSRFRPKSRTEGNHCVAYCLRNRNCS